MTGIGTMIFPGAYDRVEGPVFLCGLIPLFVGGSLLAYSYFFSAAK
jgi:hypothetical protein